MFKRFAEWLLGEEEGTVLVPVPTWKVTIKMVGPTASVSMNVSDFHSGIKAAVANMPTHGYWIGNTWYSGGKIESVEIEEVK